LEIAENHVNNKQIYLVGLNERGFFSCKFNKH